MKNHAPRKQPDRDKTRDTSKRTSAIRKPDPLPTGIPIQTEGRLTMAVPNGLRVILTREAFAQLFGYVYATPVEISCLGTAIQEGESFKINHFHLLKQTGSSSHTEMSPEAVAELAEALLADGKTSEARSIRVWAHSHPGMGLFWSETDEQTCRTLVSDYLISLVVGQGFSARCRIDLSGPITLTLDHVPVLYETNIDEALLETYRQEVKEKLSQQSVLASLTPERPDRRVQAARDDKEYCEFCGGWHTEGHCPMEEEGYGDLMDWESGGGPYGLDPSPPDPGDFVFEEEEPCE